LSEQPAEVSASSPRRRWYQAIGPGLITACVVIGPGSILTSSKVGATYGFGIVWVLFVAVTFMMVYMTLGAKLGVVAGDSPGDLLTRLVGRWLAAVIGCGVFFISAAFQFGNNLGVYSAIEVYVPDPVYTPYIVVAFNILAIAFLFIFKNLYRMVERLMTLFVGLMLFAFAANLVFALVHGSGDVSPAEQDKADVIAVLGWIGTTFAISAAYYQAYLVRQKGWGRPELRNGLIDARVGSIILACITLMIMSTSAIVLRGQTLTGVGQVAAQLKPLFGVWGQGLFCLGLFSAAYSSFIVNSMIGGFILADGLGLGHKPVDLWPRIATTAVLLVGMVVALLVCQLKINPLPAIVAAQAVTVVAAPLSAAALLWLTNRADVMGDDRNGVAVNLVAGLGFVMLLLIAGHVAVNKVWPQLAG
jgi:Mn2+/Fe2+ NRAMP family transporter